MTRLLPASAASLAILAAVTIHAEPAAEPTIDAAVPADFVEHAIEGGVTLRAPADWRPAPPKSLACKLYLVRQGQPPLNVTLVIAPAKPGQTVEAQAAGMPAVLRKLHPGANVVARVVRVGAHRASELIYDASDVGGIKISRESFEWVENGVDYVLGLTTTGDAVDAAKARFEQVVVSFRLPDDAPITVAPAATAADATPSTQPAKDLSSPAGWIQHVDRATGASLSAPAEWHDTNEKDGSIGLVHVAPHYANLNIVISPVDPNLTLAAAMQAGIDADSRQIPGFVLQHADVVPIGSRRVARTVFDAVTPKHTSLRTCQYSWLDGGTCYVLTLSTTPPEFDGLRPTFEQIAASFRPPASSATPGDAAKLADSAKPIDRSKPPVALTATVPADFVEHSAGVFTLRTPATWRQVNPPPVPEATFAMTTGIKDALFAVRVGPRQHGQTAESTRDALPGVFAQHAPNFKLVSADVVRLPSGPAARVVFDFDVGGVRARTVTFAIGSGDSEYQLATIAPVDAFDALMPTIEQVVTSVRIAAAPAAPTATPKPAAVVPPAPLPPTATPAAPSPPPPADLGGFVPKWQKADGTATPLIATMTGTGTRAADGTFTLARGQRMHSSQQFVPPVTFRIVARSDGKDVRLSYAFRQMIFDWEMRPTELRVDGGPIDGKHKPGAGALPTNQWTAIELVVTRTDLAVFVDGVQRYRMPGDFTKINAPLGIDSHGGALQVGSVDVVR